MKIISFLGFTNYTETTYLHPTTSQTVTTPFFQEALVEFYKPDILYVLLTATVATKIPRGATESNWTALQKRLAEKVNLEPIFDIPESSSPEDGWIIFDKITGCLNQGDHVIFDLTHSFRSIPVIALLAISYLRTVRQVNIEGVLYGAFDPNAQGKLTPSYDLLPMLSLLDWIAATDRFVKVGDGLPLAELLKTAIPGSERQNNPAVRLLADQLDQTAKVITQISQAIALVRPLETLNLTGQLENVLNKANVSIDQRAKPFSLISEQLLKEYGQFALKEPIKTEDLTQNLWLQFQMVNWYMVRGQIMQAMTLAAEWLISVVAYRLKIKDLLEKQARQQVRLALNNGIFSLRGKRLKKLSQFDKSFEAFSDFKSLTQLWNELGKIRNDIAHVGMSKTPESAEKLREKAGKIFPRLQKVADSFIYSD